MVTHDLFTYNYSNPLPVLGAKHPPPLACAWGHVFLYAVNKRGSKFFAFFGLFVFSIYNILIGLSVTPLGGTLG